ncbi:hypothetical protein D3C73_971160 [compost metagenome]
MSSNDTILIHGSYRRVIAGKMEFEHTRTEFFVFVGITINIVWVPCFQLYISNAGWDRLKHIKERGLIGNRGFLTRLGVQSSNFNLVLIIIIKFLNEVRSEYNIERYPIGRGIHVEVFAFSIFVLTVEIPGLSVGYPC